MKGTVVDPTSAPLPGVTVELFEGPYLTASTTTNGDGTFTLPACRSSATIVASLTGFGPARVTCKEAAHIVLQLASVSETTTVTAPDAVESDSPTSGGMDSRLSGKTLGALPTPTQHVREALPMLPSVVRGGDGLLHIDGVRPHEAPLLLDGFNVTDPATGLSSIDPPIESVANVDVLRDPMAVTFGRALGSMASIETRTGTDPFDAGIQSFLPRPRLSGQGFGTLEGFSPRAHVGGRSGALQYFVAGEYDFNRFAVPGVTTSSGSPDSRDTKATLFARADLGLSSTHVLSFEGLVFPSNQMYHGLSPLRTPDASPTLVNRDIFGGLVDRLSLGTDDVLTLRVGVLSHYAEEGPNGTGQAEMTPSGWSEGLFTSSARTARRIESSASWARKLRTSTGLHDLTVQASLQQEQLDGTVTERPVEARDAAGALVRRIDFGGPTSFAAQNRGVGVALRDLWHASEQLEVDAGVRSDWNSLGGSAPSARLGFRYTTGNIAIKGGVGEFVGTVPLSVPAFADYPERFDQQFSAASGGAPVTTALQPVAAQLSLPRALAANARVERTIAPGWDALLGVNVRHASHLATLDVRPSEEALLVASTGQSTYRSVEVAVRRTWGESDKVFLSYTRSSSRGEVNDFSSLFANGDVEVLQPGGMARLATDAPHRLLAWGTITLPAGFSIAPAVDWHSGFAYSVLDPQWAYVEALNSRSFPAFFSLDVVVFKSLTVAHRRVKVNGQVFNLTNHFNPRDVFNVMGASQFGTFTNSVGPTFRGDISVNW